MEKMMTNGMKVGQNTEQIYTENLLLHIGHICHSRRKENDYDS